jgi:hypothetical protein
MSLSDDALARLLGLDAAPATTDAPPETETEIEAPAEDDAAQAHHDRAHIDRTRLPTRWAAELDLLDRMHEGEPMPDTAIQTRRQLEGRGVLVRRDGGVFEVQHTPPDRMDHHTGPRPVRTRPATTPPGPRRRSVYSAEPSTASDTRSPTPRAAPHSASDGSI